MQKIKVGDYVRRLSEYRAGVWKSKDKSYKVIEVDYSAGTLFIAGEGRWDLDRFELAVATLTIEQKIALAESFIGKKLQYKDTNSGKGSTWRIVRKGQASSISVVNVAKEDGYCVCVEFDNSLLFPVELLTIIPDFKEIKLNDTYTAKVYDDRVEVGCQTFTKDVIKQLVKLL